MARINTVLLSVTLLLLIYSTFHKQSGAITYLPTATTKTTQIIQPNNDRLAQRLDDFESQLNDIQTQLAKVSKQVTNIPTTQKMVSPTKTDRTAQNTEANNMVNDFIASGSMSGNDFITVQQKIGQMDPAQQKLALSRLAKAINEQRIDINPNGFN